MIHISPHIITYFFTSPSILYIFIFKNFSLVSPYILSYLYTSPSILYIFIFKNFLLVSPYLPSHSLPLLIPHSLFSSFPPNPQVFLQLFHSHLLGKKMEKMIVIHSLSSWKKQWLILQY